MFVENEFAGFRVLNMKIVILVAICLMNSAVNILLYIIAKNIHTSIIFKKDKFRSL